MNHLLPLEYVVGFLNTGYLGANRSSVSFAPEPVSVLASSYVSGSKISVKLEAMDVVTLSKTQIFFKAIFLPSSGYGALGCVAPELSPSFGCSNGSSCCESSTPDLDGADGSEELELAANGWI